jgi:flagellar biosynthetic protein FliR
LPAWSIPQTGQQNPMLGQFLTILATFLFLAIGGHLALAATIVESYRALPPGDAWLSAGSINGSSCSAACCLQPGCRSRCRSASR